jgi:hypothetical protein
MATRPPHNRDEQQGGGYERRDAKIGGLLQFGFWLAVLVAITLFGMRWTFDYFVRTEPLGPPASPLVQPSQRVLPPSPRLQAQPHQELVDYCRDQQAEVNSYGWVDRDAGVVRIPISRAMDLVLARGLPTRPAGEAPTGPAAVALGTTHVAGGDDLEGPCAYLQSPPPPATEAEK